LLALAVLAVAALYGSVGHGGASGYLAVMALAGLPKGEIATTSLVLNLIVASIGAWQYLRAGHRAWPGTLPFLIGSVPLALVGGTLKLSERTYFFALAVVLTVAGVRLLMPDRAGREAGKPPAIWLALTLGAAIGLLSGMVGVGGGIFLSPLLILAGWASAKETSSTSALFILANSVAGLAGRVASDQAHLSPQFLPLAAAALVGGFAGSWLGAHRLSNAGLRRVLGVVLLVATIKLVIDRR
jgi:uncharacterized membrane protein YfcA